MSHSHSHRPTVTESRPGLSRTLAVVVGLITVATAAAIVLLWPHTVPHAPNPFGGDGVSIVNATVMEVEPFACDGGQTGPDETLTAGGNCAEVTASTKSGTATFQLDSTSYVGAPMQVGAKIKVVRFAPDGQEPSWQFYDYRRGGELLLLGFVFALAVVAVGRLRGLLALVGVGVSLLVFTQFMVPAMLAGKPPLAVAIAGSMAIMLVVLYLAHGVSIRTTAALLGTFAGLAITASLGVFTASWAQLTGVGTETDRLLVAHAPSMSLSAVVGASMVVAGLGVLNDVTITQASAVWELRSAQPDMSRSGLFASAMRIGSDHIASSVYTLVFAYAGSAMTVFLLIGAYDQSLVQMATTEEIGQEVARTLVGGIGLVLAVPITTALAVAFAPAPLLGRDSGHATAASTL